MDLEDDLTGAPIDASNIDNLTVSEVENSDEAITAVAKARNEMEIDHKQKQKREAYKYTVNIYIEN